jgi:hypothetical protein
LAGMETTAARSPLGSAGEVMVRIVWLPIRTANTCGPVRTYVTALPRAKQTGQLSGPVPPPKTGNVAVGYPSVPPLGEAWTSVPPLRRGWMLAPVLV